MKFLIRKSNLMLELLSFFILSSLTAQGRSEERKRGPEPKHAVVNKIAKQFMITSAKKYHLIPSAIGSSCYTHEGMYDKTFSFDLKDIPPPTKDEIRYLVLTLCQDFIDRINSSKEYKKYWEKAYSIENIDLAIFFHDYEGEMVLPPSIASASQLNGYLRYSKCNPKTRGVVDPLSGKAFDQEKESLEKAMELNEAFLQKVNSGEATCCFIKGHQLRSKAQEELLVQ